MANTVVYVSSILAFGTIAIAMYKLFKFASVIIPRLPGWCVPVLADVTGLLAFLIATKARKQATINMTHVLGKEVVETSAGRRQLRRTVIQMFQNNVRNYLDLFTHPILITRKDSELDGYRGHRTSRASIGIRERCNTLSAHFGPIQLSGSMDLNQRLYDLIIPVEHLKDERILDLTLKLRNSQGVQFIPLGGSAPCASDYSERYETIKLY